jgi:hypothetical protein
MELNNFRLEKGRRRAMQFTYPRSSIPKGAFFPMSKSSKLRAQIRLRAMEHRAQIRLLEDEFATKNRKMAAVRAYVLGIFFYVLSTFSLPLNC